MASIYFNPNDQSTWTVKPLLDRPHYYLREVGHDVIYPQSVHKLADPRRELAELAPRLHDVLFQ